MDKEKLIKAAKKEGLKIEFNSKYPGFYFGDSGKHVSFDYVVNNLLKKGKKYK